MNIQHHAYRPITVSSLFTAHNSQAENYAFASKERDTETGLSYFGARYYSADLSVWLSVDPMVDKYPSFSPYVYCANNPVKLVNPNGEDYEVVVDNESMTITIKATYYTTAYQNQNIVLEKGVSFWNGESGKYSFLIGEGADEKKYTILFDLKSVVCSDEKEANQKSSANSSNRFDLLNNISGYDGLHIRNNGSDWAVVSSNAKDAFRSAGHEIGHTLGIGEFGEHDSYGFGIMISGGLGDVINENHIASSLSYAGFQVSNETNSPMTNVKVQTNGVAIGKGKVIRK